MNTAKIPKSRYPVTLTDLPTSCLGCPCRRPSSPAADPCWKESVSLQIFFLYILPSGGRGSLRSPSAGGYFSCKAVKVSEEKVERPFDEQSSLIAPLISPSVKLLLTRLCKASFWSEYRQWIRDDSHGEISGKSGHAMYSSTCFCFL